MSISHSLPIDTKKNKGFILYGKICSFLLNKTLSFTQRQLHYIAALFYIVAFFYYLRSWVNFLDKYDEYWHLPDNKVNKKIETGFQSHDITINKKLWIP